MIAKRKKTSRKRTKRESKRFSAKLLFQFRVMIDGDPGKRRICEERIIHFKARSAKDALRIAKRRGKKGQHNWVNTDRNKVFVDFIGVRDLMRLGLESKDDEVWYDIKQYLLPMERKNQLIPSDKKLLTSPAVH